MADLLGANVIEMIQRRPMKVLQSFLVDSAAHASNAFFIVMVERCEIGGNVRPLLEECVAPLLDRIEVKKLSHCNGPAEGDHDYAHADGNPTVEHHVSGNILE